MSYIVYSLFKDYYSCARSFSLLLLLALLSPSLLAALSRPKKQPKKQW
jgi:hypothetical protein